MCVTKRAIERHGRGELPEVLVQNAVLHISGTGSKVRKNNIKVSGTNQHISHTGEGTQNKSRCVIFWALQHTARQIQSTRAETFSGICCLFTYFHGAFMEAKAERGLLLRGMSNVVHTAGRVNHAESQPLCNYFITVIMSSITAVAIKRFKGALLVN